MSNLTFAGINSALSGLFAAQEALNTVSSDITNANTPGYSREQVDLTAVQAFPGTGVSSDPGRATASLGGGVNVADISRVRNQFLDDQYRSSNLTLSEQTTTNQYIGQIQGLFNEPSSTGLQAQLNTFFDAWSTLAANPTQASARGALVQSAESLANSFNETSSSLTSVRHQVDSQLTTSVTQVDNILKQVASLNKQISTALGTGAQPNALMDQRDQLFDQLSGFLNVQLSERSNGETWVYTSGKVLVAGDEVTPLTTAQNGEDTFSDVTYNGATINAADLGGQLKSLLNIRDQLIGRPVVPSTSDLPNTPGGILYQMDTMANSLATSVNSLTEAGTTLNQAGITVTASPPGQSFFTINTTGGQFNTSVIDASNIQVNPTFDAAGGLNEIPVGGPPVAGVAPPAGDNTTATAVGALRDALVSDGTFGDPSSSGTYTAADLYRNMLTQLGTQGQAAQNMQQNQQALVDQVNTQRQSASGVNLDEEMSNLIKYQHSYEASAKVISTISQLLGTLMNIVQ